MATESMAIEWERRVLEAIFDRDTATMAELMSPDGFGFDATIGLVRQSELVKGIHSLSHDARFEMQNARAISVEPELIAVTYALWQWGTFDGVELPDSVYCTSLWTLKNAQWQALFHHETFPHQVRT